MADLHSKDDIKEVVKSALLKGKKKIPEDLYDKCIEEVHTLDDNYQKVIGFGCKYILSCHFIL